MTLYRNMFNLRYYRVKGGKVYTPMDAVVWRPSVFTGWDILHNPNIFVAVEPPSVTLENK